MKKLSKILVGKASVFFFPLNNFSCNFTTPQNLEYNMTSDYMPSIVLFNKTNYTAKKKIPMELSAPATKIIKRVCTICKPNVKLIKRMISTKTCLN